MVSPQGPSSFIPKTPTSAKKARPRGVRKIYVFTYISLVLFFGTLIASAGTFFFYLTVNAQLEEQKQELANERNAFNASDLERLRELEGRIENAKQLLDTHVSVAAIFEALEQSTAQTVQLTGVVYERSQFGDIALTVGALTDDLNDARFQSDIYASNEVLRKAGVTEPQLTTREQQFAGDVISSQQAVIFTLAGDFAVGDIPYRAPANSSFQAEEQPVFELGTSSESVATTTETTDTPVTNGDEI